MKKWMWVQELGLIWKENISLGLKNEWANKAKYVPKNIKSKVT
jgi:hypothetical protein